MFDGPLTESMVQRAQDKGLVEIGFVDPRDFTEDKHRSVDDRPYGGGPGMVLMAEPVARAIESVRREESQVIFLSPQGERFTQNRAESLRSVEHVVLLCGHYEGVDERILSLVDMELSLGDFVMTGGEIAAMAVIDAVTRLIPGVLPKEEAAREESFSTGVLDFPQYTRPREWRGQSVPDVLLEGDHAKIESWRREKALEATQLKRPDLLENEL